MHRIRLWPVRRDDYSGVLIGAGGTRRSDWPARVLADDASTRIDRYFAREELAATVTHLLSVSMLADLLNGLLLVIIPLVSHVQSHDCRPEDKN